MAAAGISRGTARDEGKQYEPKYLPEFVKITSNVKIVKLSLANAKFEAREHPSVVNVRDMFNGMIHQILFHIAEIQMYRLISC